MNACEFWARSGSWQLDHCAGLEILSRPEAEQGSPWESVCRPRERTETLITVLKPALFVTLEFGPFAKTVRTSEPNGFDAALEIDGVRSAIRRVGTCQTRSNGFAGRLLHPHAHERWIPPL